jgi:hypothetical protein
MFFGLAPGIILSVTKSAPFHPVDPRRVLVANGLRELLLAVEHDHGVAGVSRDRNDGSYWLSGSVEHGGGSGISRAEAPLTRLDGSWAQGGLLPAGATRALVRDESGTWTQGAASVDNGVWIVITRLQPVAVRFESETGAIVPQPIVPDPIERDAVADATAPCAACGAAEWDLVRFPIRYPGEEEDGPQAVVCRRCGHQVDMGVWISFGVDDDDDGDEPEGATQTPPADWWAEQAASSRRAFAQAAFPVYGLSDWHGRRWWSGAGGSSPLDSDDLGEDFLEVQEIRLGFGPPDDDGRPRASVETQRGGHVEAQTERLRNALQELAGRRDPADHAWGRLSHAALEVKLEEDRLRAGEEADAVETHEVLIRVDGEARPFLAGSNGTSWAAVTTIQIDPESPEERQLNITILAENIALEQVALARVDDIEPYLREPPI